MKQACQLALAQMRVVLGDRAGNLGRAVARIAEAATRGADVVLLPEALDLGWAHPAALARAEPIPGGPGCELLRHAAADHRIFVCAGLSERVAGAGAGGTKVFNSAVLFGPGGELLLHHRKINELDFARRIYSVGDRLGVVDTSIGRIGLMICADAFAAGQAISRTLGMMGATLILSPCAWAVPADHDNVREPYGQLWWDNYSPAVREFGLTIAGCSNVGPITAGEWAGRKCIGNSLVCAPGPRLLARGTYGESAEELLLVNVGVPASQRTWGGDAYSSAAAGASS